MDELSGPRKYWEGSATVERQGVSLLSDIGPHTLAFCWLVAEENRREAPTGSAEGGLDTEVQLEA
jgi:hypothetical protein